MSRTGWKAAERTAAKLIQGSRFKANTGGRLDVESQHYIGQVKQRKNLSLAQVELLATEMAAIGIVKKKSGLLLVKRSAGKGVKTPWLVVLHIDTWRGLFGPELDQETLEVVE